MTESDSYNEAGYKKLTRTIQGQAQNILRLLREVDELKAERDALKARVAELESSDE